MPLTHPFDIDSPTPTYDSEYSLVSSTGRYDVTIVAIPLFKSWDNNRKHYNCIIS